MLYFFASLSRYESFYTSNWDLGINMQMLWTNTHGYLLFETGDAMSYGVGSFLAVHTTYVAIPVSYLYGAYPYASTLFALQAIAVAASAIPLYLVGRDAEVPQWLLLGGLVVYLLSLPILSSVLYDFHWEAFIPGELLWTYYLWNRRRYLLAVIPAILGVLTLEVFPFLLLGLALYFSYPYLHSVLYKPATIRRWKEAIPGLLPILGLAILAAAAYGSLRLIEYNVIPMLTGSAVVASGSQGYNAVGGFLTVHITWAHTVPSVVYWFLLMASFGFLPLLTRRSLLLASAPWFAYSALISPYVSKAYGNQYAFIAVAPLAIAFIEGLGILYRASEKPTRLGTTLFEWPVVVLPLFVAACFESVALLGVTPAGLETALALAIVSGGIVATDRTLRNRRVSTPAPGPRASAAGDRRQRLAKTSAMVALTLLVAAGLLMSPLNPVNFEATVLPGYQYTYSENPVYPYLPGLQSAIPSGASVLASDNLFPFVANDPHAYSLLWETGLLPFFPFNDSHLPQYVLISTSQWFAVPTFLPPLLFNTSEYGIVEMVYYTGYPGSVYLFERGYTDSPVIHEVVPFSTDQTICPYTLGLGASGSFIGSRNSLCGTLVGSRPSTNLSGNGRQIWYSPSLVLLPGNYTVTLSLAGGLDLPTAPPQNIFFTNASEPDGGQLYSVNVSSSLLSPERFTNLTFTFDLREPLPQVVFGGFIVPYDGGARGFVLINFLRIQTN
ncbi:MAG: DUF2079 domain-containing protein [Thermoplasmata archaeon]